MLIPRELVLLLGKLYGYTVDGKLTPPSVKERIEIYLEALAYVEKDIKLFSYVLGHRRLVTKHDFKKIDEILLELIVSDPNIIPSDYKQRLPKDAKITLHTERLYMRDKEYKKLSPEPERVFQLAAE